jgi:hypothetical protein
MLTKTAGVAPGLRGEIELRDKAMSGDIVLTITPATCGSSAAAIATAIAGAAKKFTRQVVVELKTSAGKRHTWFDGDLAIAATEDGEASIIAIAANAQKVSLKKGKGLVTLEYTGVWAEGGKGTLTVTGGTILGYTVANKTSVDTVVA